MMTLTRRDILATGLVGSIGMATGAPLAAQAGFDSTARVAGKVERLDPALDALIDADAVVEPLTEGLIWCEGPTWIGGKDGHLLYSDVKGNQIHRLKVGEGDTTWLKPSGYVGPLFPESIQEPGSNGLYATRHGLLVADSGNRCLVRIDLRTKRRTVLHDRFEGKRFNSPNDICISPRDGSIYFTDPAYGLKDTLKSPLRELDFTGIFRVKPDNSLSLVGRVEVPNGIGISPDGTTLYCTDVSRGWLAHRLDSDGMIAETRTFIDPATAGIARGDGLKIDSGGNMWTSMRGGIAVVSPAGRVLGKIVTNSIVSNCELGADGYLYMSCNHQMARIRVTARKLIVE
jgi:gluconolactonase